MKIHYDTHRTHGAALPDEYLELAVAFRRETHPQPNDGLDPPKDEIARIVAERQERLPRIGRGVVTFALAETHVAGEFNPVGCFHAYTQGGRGKRHQEGGVLIDGVWLDKGYMNAGISLEMVEAGLSVETFRPDQRIGNGEAVLPALLSGALDDPTGEARWLIPTRTPETVEEARLAINAILTPPEAAATPILSQPLVTAQI